MALSLEQAIRIMIEIYKNYSVSSGNEHIMRKRNLKKLIQNEMNVGPILQKPEYRSLMADLDSNQDGIVDFEEYVDILHRVSIAEGTTST